MWLPLTWPPLGPGPQPRHMPWLGIEPETLWFAGRHSIHWATPARAEIFLYKQFKSHSMKLSQVKMTGIWYYAHGPQIRLFVLHDEWYNPVFTNWHILSVNLTYYSPLRNLKFVSNGLESPYEKNWLWEAYAPTTIPPRLVFLYLGCFMHVPDLRGPCRHRSWKLLPTIINKFFL